MREIDHKLIDAGEAMARFLVSQEGQSIMTIISDRKTDLSRDLSNIGRKPIMPGMAEYYAHRIAALNELEDEIERIIDDGRRERTRLVEMEAATDSGPQTDRPEKATEE